MFHRLEPADAVCSVRFPSFHSELKGEKRIFDIGRGRGALLLMAAQRLPRGRAVGIDFWSAIDQSGDAEKVSRQNAAVEGVAERVELYTANLRKLPFDDLVVGTEGWDRLTKLVRQSKNP